MKKFVVSFVLLLFLSPLLQASEESPISVKAEVDKATLTIGEHVEYRITVTRDPSVEILSPLAPPSFDPFELKEAHDFSEKQGKQRVEGRRFILTTYELGEFILEPVTIRYRTAKGQEKTMQTNRLFLTVKSVEPSGKPKTDIRGPKGPLELKRRWGWLWILILFLGALSGGFYGWWRWKHRSLEGVKAAEAELSPEDEALLALNRLFDSDLIRRGKMKEYFLELSEILRRYFERRFEILAVESTTSEILRDLKDKELPEPLRQKIQEVLEAADLVKFAKWMPSPSEIVRTNHQAKEIVEEARPKVPAHGV